MTIKASQKRNTHIKFVIALVSLMTIAFVLTSWFSQSNSKMITNTAVTQITRELSLPVNVTNVDETNSLKTTNFSRDSSYSSNSKDAISSDNLNQSGYEKPDLSQLVFSFLDSTNQDQIDSSKVTLPQSHKDINITSGLDTVDSFK